MCLYFEPQRYFDLQTGLAPMDFPRGFLQDSGGGSPACPTHLVCPARRSQLFISFLDELKEPYRQKPRAAPLSLLCSARAPRGRKKRVNRKGLRGENPNLRILRELLDGFHIH